jgi:hypothetical protein
MNQQMALYRPTMYGGGTGPTANFSGSPTSGFVPLTVQFADESTGSPTSWDWTFGDGGTSTAQNPGHTYDAVGTYTVTLTVANADGSDTLTRTDYITVTDPGGGGTMHVADIVVGRKAAGPNRNGTCTVTVVDEGGAAVASATVYVDYDGPNSGSLSGVTGAGGTVDFSTPKLKNPTGEWCFEVTNITHATLDYNAADNVVTRSCESGDVYREGALATSLLSLRTSPNPFNPMTVIHFELQSESAVTLRIYDVQGHLVETLVNRSLGAGPHAVTWDARDRASGVYFCRVRTRDAVEIHKMALLK